MKQARFTNAGLWPKLMDGGISDNRMNLWRRVASGSQKLPTEYAEGDKNRLFDLDPYTCKPFSIHGQHCELDTLDWEFYATSAIDAR